MPDYGVAGGANILRARRAGDSDAARRDSGGLRRSFRPDEVPGAGGAGGGATSSRLEGSSKSAGGDGGAVAVFPIRKRAFDRRLVAFVSDAALGNQPGGGAADAGLLLGDAAGRAIRGAGDSAQGPASADSIGIGGD